MSVQGVARRGCAEPAGGLTQGLPESEGSLLSGAGKEEVTFSLQPQPHRAACPFRVYKCFFGRHAMDVDQVTRQMRHQGLVAFAEHREAKSPSQETNLAHSCTGSVFQCFSWKIQRQLCQMFAKIFQKKSFMWVYIVDPFHVIRSKFGWTLLLIYYFSTHFHPALAS